MSNPNKPITLNVKGYEKPFVFQVQNTAFYSFQKDMAATSNPAAINELLLESVVQPEKAEFSEIISKDFTLPTLLGGKVLEELGMMREVTLGE